MSNTTRARLKYSLFFGGGKSDSQCVSFFFFFFNFVVSSSAHRERKLEQNYHDTRWRKKNNVSGLTMHSHRVDCILFPSCWTVCLIVVACVCPCACMYVCVCMCVHAWWCFVS